MNWMTNKHLAMAAAVSAAVVGGIAISPTARDTVGATSADVMSMLTSRSPGSRSDGAVTTKGPRMAMAPTRTSRVLPIARAARPAAIPAVAAPQVAPAILAAPTSVAPIAPAVAGTPILGAVPAVATGGPGLGAAALLPVPLIAGVIGGPGGGGVTVVPSPTPAIPEPGTWLMMIVGFGMLGGVLRRRRRLELNRAGRLPAAPAAAR